MPPDNADSINKEEEEVKVYEQATIQLTRNTTSKRLPPAHIRLKLDLQGPPTDRVTPPPQTKPPPADHSANLHQDNMLEDSFTSLLTETNSIIDAITDIVHHRTTTLDQHVQNEGPDVFPYVLTVDSTEGEDTNDPPVPEAPMESPHQQIRGTAFTRQ